MKNKIISPQDDWMTPPTYLEKLGRRFRFDFDPCPYQHDINKWNGLEREWGESNFVNPGYSLPVKTDFVMWGIEQYKLKKQVVFLLPVSTSTVLFKDHIEPIVKIEFERGRIPFIGINLKGQYVNFHQIMEVTKEKILYADPKKGIIEIPKFKKSLGQNDSMLCILKPKKIFKFFSF